jgi:hypothetical protein
MADPTGPDTTPAAEPPADTSTALAPKRDLFGKLPEHLKAALDFRRQEAQVAAELGRLNWGGQLEMVTRRAVVSWARQHDVDPTTEIDVLGNRIYVNSKYFYRKLAAMIAAEAVIYAFPDHIHADARLDELAAAGDTWGREEKARRLQERIRYNIPDKAAAAVVFRIMPRAMDTEIVGAKWVGGRGTRAGSTKLVDPVGDEHPAETAESRAMRRAMLKLAESTDNSTAKEILATMQSVEIIQDRVGPEMEKFQAEEAASRPRWAQTMMPDDIREGEVPLPPEAIQRLAGGGDPYDQEAGAES